MYDYIQNETFRASSVGRTDMAAEFAVGASHDGVVVRHLQIPYPVTEVVIATKAAAQKLGKPCGRYFTVEGLDFSLPPQDMEGLICSIKPLLWQLLPQNIRFALVVGLGNRSITPDSLGPKAAQYTLVTRHLQGEFAGSAHFGVTAAVAPGVLGQTGIEAADLVKAICKETKPDLVIAVDALAAGEKERLCRSLQFSDTGIAPGSGVKNHRLAIDRASLGVPVISVGVPTVVETDGGMFVTQREVDLCMEHAGRLIAMILNCCLHPKVDFDTLSALAG